MLTIAWDIDDVLNDLMRLWFEQVWHPAHPDCLVHYKDLTENPPNNILNITQDEYLASLDSFRLSDSFMHMKPVIETKNWFVKNGDKFRHFALTSTPLIAAGVSANWVFNNFGVWIRSFHFVPSKRVGQEIPQYNEDKSEFLKLLGKVDIIVDDNESNIKKAQNLGIKGILIPRPWNSSRLTILEAFEKL
jgi:5'(3')-deoxyribonucleotidase